MFPGGNAPLAEWAIDNRIAAKIETIIRRVEFMLRSSSGSLGDAPYSKTTPSSGSFMNYNRSLSLAVRTLILTLVEQPNSLDLIFRHEQPNSLDLILRTADSSETPNSL